jgi:hypothetical protein
LITLNTATERKERILGQLDDEVLIMPISASVEDGPPPGSIIQALISLSCDG